MKIKNDNKQVFEKWVANPSEFQFNESFEYLLSQIINPRYDANLNETNMIVEKFLLSLNNFIKEDNFKSENLPIVYGCLSSLLVELGQYRHEIAKINMPQMVKLRNHVVTLMKDVLSNSIFVKLDKDISEEVVPLIESCIDRFYPYRVARICSVAERFYEISERTSEKTVKDIFLAFYNLKYTRFGTSGVRGVWEKDITIKRVEAVVQAICDSIKNDEKVKGKAIVLGYDSRFHADNVAYWVAGVLIANGFQVHMTKRDTPTPVISYFALEKLKDDIAGVIVCTASHNPPEWQGVKYILYNGMQAPTSVTDWIGARANQLLILNKPILSFRDFEIAESEGKIKMFDPMNDYCEWLLSKPKEVGLNIELIKDYSQEKLIVIDEMHGAGRGYLGNMLSKLDIPFIVVHGIKDSMFGNLQYANPEEPYTADCQYMVKRMGAIIGLAMDADADRFAAIDGDGTLFSPNQLIALLAEYLLKHRGMGGKVIHSFTCFPFLDEIITSLDIDEKLIKPDPCAIPSYVIHPFYVLSLGSGQQIAGAPAYVTMVGMKYLAEAMMMNCHYKVENTLNIRESMIIAGEESGGLTTKGHIPDKDGLWADMLLLEMISFHKKSLKEIWGELTTRIQTEIYSARLDVDGTEEAKDKLVDFYLYDFLNTGRKIGGMECTYIGGIRNDFVELHLENVGIKGRLIVRASGTEPICRIYTECTQETKRREIETDALRKFEEISLEEVKKAHNPWHLIDILLVTPPLSKIILGTREKLKQFETHEKNVTYTIYEKLGQKVKRLDTRRRIMAETWLPIIEGWKNSEI
jgi:phosphomannomutase